MRKMDAFLAHFVQNDKISISISTNRRFEEQYEYPKTESFFSRLESVTELFQKAKSYNTVKVLRRPVDKFTQSILCYIDPTVSLFKDNENRIKMFKDKLASQIDLYLANLEGTITRKDIEQAIVCGNDLYRKLVALVTDTTIIVDNTASYGEGPQVLLMEKDTYEIKEVMSKEAYHIRKIQEKIEEYKQKDTHNKLKQFLVSELRDIAKDIGVSVQRVQPPKKYLLKAELIEALMQKFSQTI